MSTLSSPAIARLLFALFMLTWVAVRIGPSASLPPASSVTAGEYIVLDMNDATKTGTLTVTVTTQCPKPPPSTGTVTSKTTVQIDVQKGDTAEDKMQSLADALDQASPDGATDTTLKFVDATYVATPPHLVIAAAPQPQGDPVQTLTNVSTKDKTGQTVKERRGHTLVNGTSIGGQIVMFREPASVTVDGGASTVWVGSERGQVSYAIGMSEGLDELTSNLLDELLGAGFAATSPATGVILLRLNQNDDGLAMSFGSNDASLVFALELTD